MRTSKTRNGDTKFCSGCDQWKHVNEFNKRADVIGTHQEQYRSRCKVCCDKQAKANNLKNPKSMKEAQWRQKGITNFSFEQFQELLILQQELCAICKQEERAENRSLAVDHNHETGQIRGLLCGSCNTKLGWVEKYFTEIHSYLE